MLLVKAWVGPSKIQGFGLIAHEFIPKDTIVWRFAPGFDVVLSEAEVQKLPPPAREQVLHYGFFSAVLDRHILCADDDRFTNHSDSANTRFHGDHATAIRDIHPGEEITDDYTAFGKPMHRATRPPAREA